MAESVYVLVFASPDQVVSEVFATKADCKAAFHAMVEQVSAHYEDDPSLDMALSDGAEDGTFEDGYGITLQWAKKNVQ